MSWSEAEETRICAIEEVVNQLQIAVQNNLASKQQLRQLLNIKQQEIEALTNRVASLESEIAILQAEIG